MKIIRLQFLAASLLSIICLSSFSIYAQEASNLESNNTCYTCHTSEEMLPEDFSKQDVHFQFGLTCADCHGGDPRNSNDELSMSESKGFIGAPEGNQIPKVCGKCHSDINYMRRYKPRIATDQVAQYYQSVHGQKLSKGDENVAQCASCHTAHNILPASDPRSTIYAMNIPSTCNQCHGDEDLMNEYNLEANQFEEYSESVHGIALFQKKDISAPVCNDCHGNHGAAPPGLASVSNVCGTCHVQNLEFFKSSVMSKEFDKRHYHGCEQCHDKHKIIKPTDDMVSVSEDSFCIKCHSKGDAGYNSAIQIHSRLTLLNSLKDSAEALVFDVEQKGMNDVDIKFLLKDLNQNIVQTRTLIHTFDTVRIDSHTQNGINIAENAISESHTEIEEYFTRRNGLGLATIFFIIIALAMYYKIREKSKKKVGENIFLK